MRAVNDAIQDRVSQSWIPDNLVPAADGNLAGHQQRPARRSTAGWVDPLLVLQDRRDRAEGAGAEGQRLRTGGIQTFHPVTFPQSAEPSPRTAAHCRSRCSTPATWPRSPHPTIPASAWWFAPIRLSPSSGRASAKTCCLPPGKTSRVFRPLWRVRRSHCAVVTRSVYPSAGCSAGEIWPSISNSPSKKPRSASSATRPRSLARRHWTGSTWCAPASPKPNSTAPLPC
jgi:hypothetical protein